MQGSEVMQVDSCWPITRIGYSAFRHYEGNLNKGFGVLVPCHQVATQLSIGPGPSVSRSKIMVIKVRAPQGRGAGHEDCQPASVEGAAPSLPLNAHSRQYWGHHLSCGVARGGAGNTGAGLPSQSSLPARKPHASPGHSHAQTSYFKGTPFTEKPWEVALSSPDS